MTQEHQTQAGPGPSSRCNRPGRGGRLLFRALFAAALFGVVAAGAYVGASHAHPGMRGPHAAFGMGGNFDPETAARRVDAMVGFALADIDATAEQKGRIGQIARAALADLQPMRTEHKAARARAVELLPAPSIDRAALESVRQAELKLADSASRRITLAMADAADVLQPAQRTRLAEKLKQRVERRG